ncbi:MAG TPA: peptide chain release factor-like protein [Longimicrobiales bacterium]|nr:peptide chain release factor-like protein [Longimicrobiales bacterium]
MPDSETPHHERSDEDLLSDCRVDVFRSGGKGGQHQNTTNTGVRLVHRPTGIRAESRTERSQTANRRRALSRLRDKLADDAHEDPERIPTKVPKRQKRKRLRNKRHRSEKKRLRKPPELDD